MRRLILILVLAALISPGAAHGQQDTTETRAFVRGGIYDKPYLFELLGRAAFGGYAEFHTRWEREEGISEFTFVPKRFNLFTAAQVSDFVRFAAELEFEEGTEEILLEFAAIDLTIHEAFAFRAGMLLSPIGRFNLSHDSPLNEFTDRPLVSTELFGVALSEPGLGALGTIPVGVTGRITYEAYLVNGFHDGVVNVAPEGTRIPSGRRNVEDNNSAPSFVGRVTWSPSLALELGLSGHTGPYNEFKRDGAQLDERRNVSLYAVDFDASVLGFRVSGEGGFGRVNVPPSLTATHASRQGGFYLDVLRDFGQGWISTMPRSHFSVGLRLDAIDLDRDIPGDDTRQLTLGANFRPNTETVFKFNYVRGRATDRFNSAAQFAKLLFSVATYF
jgi:hypothetical protein